MTATQSLHQSKMTEIQSLPFLQLIETTQADCSDEVADGRQGGREDNRRC